MRDHHLLCAGQNRKRGEGKEQQKPQVASLSSRDRALSLEGQKMWRRAAPDSPIHGQRKRSSHVERIERAFESKSEPGEISLPGLVSVPGVPMHPAGKARELAAKEFSRSRRRK